MFQLQLIRCDASVDSNAPNESLTLSVSKGFNRFTIHILIHCTHFDWLHFISYPVEKQAMTCLLNATPIDPTDWKTFNGCGDGLRLFTHPVNFTIFVRSTFDLFDVTCEQNDGTALNPFLTVRKNADVDGSCKRTLLVLPSVSLLMVWG